MRAYFAPCGIGLGHVARSIPIAKALQNKGAEVLFSTYGQAINHARSEGFPTHSAPPISYAVEANGTVDFRSTTAFPGIFSSFIFLRQTQAEISYMKGFKPDIVVVDSRVSPIIASWLLGIPRILLLNQFYVIIPRRKRFLRLAKLVDNGTLTLIGRVWASSNAVLIVDFPPPYTLSLPNLRIPPRYKRRTKLIGPIIPVHPEELPDKVSIRRKLGFDPHKPLIYAPISGQPKEKAFVSGLLYQIFTNFPPKYAIVMSLGYPGASLEPIVKRNLTIYRWTNLYYELVKACDVMVTRAGHGTLSVAMCYGKPAVTIPVPNHTEQLGNARRAEEIGFAKIVPQELLTLEKLLFTVEEIVNDDSILSRVERIQRDVSKFNAIQTAVEVIQTIIK
jgi:UDP:flavonoid glycosyltransferase YjiC (YdhE family)